MQHGIPVSHRQDHAYRRISQAIQIKEWLGVGDVCCSLGDETPYHFWVELLFWLVLTNLAADSCLPAQCEVSVQPRASTWPAETSRNSPKGSQLMLLLRLQLQWRLLRLLVCL